MKTNVSLTLLVAGLLSAGALAVAPIAHAGPGIDYWKRTADVRNETSPRGQAVSPTACTGMKVVEVTKITHDWPNARGPLVTKVVGTKKVCTSCGGSSTVRKRDWHNGKGPMVDAQVKSEHACTACAP